MHAFERLSAITLVFLHSHLYLHQSLETLQDDVSHHIWIDSSILQMCLALHLLQSQAQLEYSKHLGHSRTPPFTLKTIQILHVLYGAEHT